MIHLVPAPYSHGLTSTLGSLSWWQLLLRIGFRSRSTFLHRSQHQSLDRLAHCCCSFPAQLGRGTYFLRTCMFHLRHCH